MYEGCEVKNTNFNGSELSPENRDPRAPKQRGEPFWSNFPILRFKPDGFWRRLLLANRFQEFAPHL
jgi:hypothetical protein